MFVIVQSKFFFPPFFKHLDHFFSLISFLNKFQNVSPRQRKDTSETRRYEIFESFSLARISFFFLFQAIVQKRDSSLSFFIRIVRSVLRVYLGCIDEYFASRGIRDSIFKRNMILACASSLRVHVKRMKRISKRNSIRMEAGVELA